MTSSKEKEILEYFDKLHGAGRKGPASWISDSPRIAEHIKNKISETRKERGIIPYNKGKKLERESTCDSCNNKFTKQGLKRHTKTCKSN